MIWDEISLMAIIDIIMLFLITLSLSDLYRNRKLLKKLKVFSGLALVVGLFTLGSLYLIDLFARHLFPMLLPTGKATVFMEDLRFNYNWILTTSGIAILVISVLYINRVIFPKIRKLENDLTVLASTDSLTGIYNRSKYNEITGREIERAKRFNLSLSIIMFDIDAFKRINDTYGHLTGDQVLETLVTLVQGEIRKIDILIRWGGDEFICILPETDLGGAIRLGERMRRLVAENKFGDIGKVTLSIGISQFIPGDNEDTLLKRADEGMYKAKMSGGNQIGGKVVRLEDYHDE
jgi:diguanylate cyclase (GGDEF)-like protein